jgi:uncharacterized repeat protein (TIGR01451 family)
VAACLLSTLVAVTIPSTALAAGTVLFQNAFNDNTVDGTGTVTMPTSPNGTNDVCLTAVGNSTVGPLLSCSGATDAQGSGKLQLTSAAFGQVGGIFGQSSFPTSSGLDVTFNSYQWGGASPGADGLAFMLAAVDPTNPTAPATIGSSGGALGYSAAPGLNGLTNAYLGIGFDVHGNFSNVAYSGTGCASVPNISATTPGAVVVRGPGSVRVGYCGLTTTYNGTSGSMLTLRAATQAASIVPVEVLINPTNAAFTSTSGVVVAAGAYKVVFTPAGSTTAQTLTGALPAVAAGLYPSSTWTNGSGVPKQLAFGFVGSTGSVSDNHQIGNVKVLTFASVPQLGMTSTSYTTAAPSAGAPVTYSDVASVLTGTDETSPISVTQTVPTGVVPVGAYGTGWVCQAPAGQTITCTTTASSFANGTTLPKVTVVAIVTGSSETSTLIQNGSTARASSSDANPATATPAVGGTIPTPPSGITVVPTIGPIAGGGTVTVSGSNITAATAIEIGTTAEQQAGTPVVLLPCPGLPAAGCFTVVLTTLVISSMPARAASASVNVTVVTSGVAAAASYVYADSPAAPAEPTAVAGITSATVTWVAPANHGSAITGYIVTPYLAGVAQTPLPFDATTTTRTLTGLIAASSYTFTVAAINLYGTSAPSPQSTAVVPYTLPGTPAITTAVAGDSAATITWTAPSNGGSAITGYVVTPYLGLVAQATQTFAGGATTETATGLTPGTAYTFTVAAQNPAGTGPASAKSSAVTPNSSPTLTFAAPPAGEVGVAYSQQLTVTNGTPPFTWTVSSGTLPTGLSLGSSGLLAGTAASAGSTTFTVQVLDASGQTATKAITLVFIAGPVVSFTPAAGQVGVAYSQQPTATGGSGGYTWTVSVGSLPGGLSLNAGTGQISGTPTATGNFSFTLSATDSKGQAGSASVTIVIAAGPLVIVKTASVSGAVAGGIVGYTITITNTGATAWTGVSVSDPLNGVLDDAGYDADASANTGTVSYNASTIGWTGTVAAGGVVTITYSVTVNDPDLGDNLLSNTVNSPTLGTNCGTGSADSRCTASTPVTARSITVAGLTSAFTLSGVPHSTVTSTGAVALKVTTNSTGGYILSVESTSTVLTAAAPGNTTTIPIALLGVRETGASLFQSMSATAALVVHQQHIASAPGGDAVSNDFQMAIPFVPPGTYSTTLTYIASTQ